MKYLQKRNLVSQYIKAKEFFENGYFVSINLKIRQPKKDEIYSFRINRQFRAFGKFLTEDLFVVFEISDHQ